MGENILKLTIFWGEGLRVQFYGVLEAGTSVVWDDIKWITSLFDCVSSDQELRGALMFNVRQNLGGSTANILMTFYLMNR